jgi:hypothetical protein
LFSTSSLSLLDCSFCFLSGFFAVFCVFLHCFLRSFFTHFLPSSHYFDSFFLHQISPYFCGVLTKMNRVFCGSRFAVATDICAPINTHGRPIDPGLCVVVRGRAHLRSARLRPARHFLTRMAGLFVNPGFATWGWRQQFALAGVTPLESGS